MTFVGGAALFTLTVLVVVTLATALGVRLVRARQPHLVASGHDIVVLALTPVAWLSMAPAAWFAYNAVLGELRNNARPGLILFYLLVAALAPLVGLVVAASQLRRGSGPLAAWMWAAIAVIIAGTAEVATGLLLLFLFVALLANSR